MNGKIAFLALAGALALGGCDSGEVPSPAERQQTQGVEAPAADLHVRLQPADPLDVRCEGA